MDPVQVVYRLRPTNAANRVGQRMVCVLNARDVQRSIDPTPVVVIELAHPASLAPGVLRAARHLDAVIGLSVPAHEMGEGPRPYAVFHDLVEAAQDADYWLPLFLKAGPIPLTGTGEAQLSEARERVFQYVDAGFTEIGFDGGHLSAEDYAAAVAAVSIPARERELSLEVRCRAEAGAVAALSRALVGQGTRADVFAVDGGGSDRWALEGIQSAAGMSVVAVPEGREGPARRVLCGDRFDRLLERLLPESLRQEIREHRASSGADLRSALGHFHEALAGLDEGCRLKIEALAYAEALSLLNAAKVGRSAPRSIEFLAEKNGY